MNGRAASAGAGAELGAVRPEATASDTFAMIRAAAWIREEVSEDQGHKLLAVMIDGLCPVG
jgi:hypothetical protein